MQPAPAPKSILPADWTEVLQTVEQTLEQAIAEAWRREQALPALPEPPPATVADPAWQQGLQRLQARFEGLQAVVRQAEQKVAEVDALLQAEAAALRQWLEAVDANRQRLAEAN